MTSGFVHLHVHTEYSLLDGLSKIDKLIKLVKSDGMKSVAITDHGVMYGAVEFYKKCEKENIKPILGMEAYLSSGSHKIKADRTKSPNFHLLLLAKNLQGYKNLMKLTSIAHLEGYYYKPRIDKETLEKYSDGLICTSGCAQGEIPQALVEGDSQRAKDLVRWYEKVFGDDFYLEIQRHLYDRFISSETNVQIQEDLKNMSKNERLINEGIIKLSSESGIPLVATNDAHYILPEEAPAQDALICIATGKNVSDTKRMRFIDAPTFYIKTESEMRELFADIPQAVDESIKLASKCNVELSLGKWFFPEYKVPGGLNAPDYLSDLAHRKLAEKFGEISPEYRDRLNYELDIIIKKGYSPYFLIVMSMVNWANSEGIITNTRGSAAGSLVSYVLGITTVDPIFYNLPFERFLNPFRPSPPDIDFDVADDKRDFVLKYISDTYGHDKVAQICTFGRMLARASVRDITRVLGFPYAKGDSIAKAIPLGSQGFPMTIEKALGISEQLSEIYNSDTDTKKIVDLARHVEGNARHISVHAAGVVVAPSEITDYSPIQYEPSGEKVITQYEMHACEDVGLIKFDILGIRNLSFLGESVALVEKIRGNKIDLSSIPLDDKKTFEMLSRGETVGVFQLAGGGITKYLKDLKPNRVEDLMAMVALYRPGPISVIPDYIQRKKNPKLVKYLDPRMKKFLDKSYGLLVYQDDLLFCALEMAGYNWEEVDKFRKAVGKKIPEEMAAQKLKFTEGIVNNGQTKQFADELWKLFEPFQSYGFNKAHAASYGMVAYQTAYMKANYPVEYMTALLTAESGDTEKITAAINECRRMGIILHPPSVNESSVAFTIESDSNSLNNQAIRFGLNAIKNVGEAAIHAILDARNKGKFLSFEDFCTRVDGRKVNKRVVESLIKVGSFSDFSKRACLLSVMDLVREKFKPKTKENQDNLFGEDMPETSANIIISDDEKNKEFDDEQIEKFERELLGFSLSAKPIITLIENLSLFATHKIFEIKEILESEGMSVKFAAVVNEVRVILTKKNASEMAFVKVEDDTGIIELVVFPKLFSTTRDIWVERKPILISGKVSARDNDISIIVDDVSTDADSASEVVIKIPIGTKREKLDVLRKLLDENPGNQKLVFNFEGKSEKVRFHKGVNWNHSLSNLISGILDSTKTE